MISGEDDHFKPFELSLHADDDTDENDESTPISRSGHRIVCDDGNFYSYGGYNPTVRVVNGYDSDDDSDPHYLFPEVWRYNFARMAWRKLPVSNIPNALASISAVLSGKILIVFGGTGVPFHIARSNKLYVCNLEDKDPSFQLVEATGTTPQALYGQAIFMKDNFLYTVGGTTGFDYFLDIHRLNLKTKVWEELYICKGDRSDPPGRYRHELAIVGDKIYIVGGGIGREAFNFENIPVFDIKTLTWDNLVSVGDRQFGYPSSRQYHSVVKIPDQSSFVMVGGLMEPHIFDDAWRLDIPSMQWTKICSLQLAKPVYFHACSVTPAGKMYIFGGVSKNDRGNHERVAAVQCAWICIPKLKEICWEAVLNNEDYFEMIEKNDPEITKLLPLEYSKRLIW